MDREEREELEREREREPQEGGLRQRDGESLGLVAARAREINK